MNTIQVENSLRGLRGKLVGVYASNRIPIKLGFPSAIVMNTQEHWKTGEHWVALYINKYGYGFYFDSYGMPPYISYHVDRIKKNCKRYEWNKNQFQGFDTKVCGQYCIVFLHYMQEGKSIKSFSKLFSKSFKENDKLIMKIYKKILAMKIKKRNNISRKYPLDVSTGTGTCIQSCTSKNYI